MLAADKSMGSGRDMDAGSKSHRMKKSSAIVSRAF